MEMSMNGVFEGNIRPLVDALVESAGLFPMAEAHLRDPHGPLTVPTTV